MPELPEVEFAVRQLRKHVSGRRITRLAAHHAAQRRTLTAKVVRAVTGRRVAGVERQGKHQLMVLDDGATLLAHFRMNGDWSYSRVVDPMPAYARITLDLDNGARVALVDSRALCALTYHPAGEPPELGLGPEPEDRKLTAGRMHALVSARRAPIKLVLLDQSVLAGIGNIYAAEALWRARINPKRAAASLTLAECTRLLGAIRAAFADGHRNAARYHTGARTTPFKVYDREGAPCRRCGSSIRRITQGQRSTYFCPTCQAK